MKTCPKCGYETENNLAKFCHKCGGEMPEYVPERPEPVVEHGTIAEPEPVAAPEPVAQPGQEPIPQQFQAPDSATYYQPNVANYYQQPAYQGQNQPKTLNEKIRAHFLEILVVILLMIFFPLLIFFVIEVKTFMDRGKNKPAATTAVIAKPAQNLLGNASTKVIA